MPRKKQKREQQQQQQKPLHFNVFDKRKNINIHYKTNI